MFLQKRNVSKLVKHAHVQGNVLSDLKVDPRLSRPKICSLQTVQKAKTLSPHVVVCRFLGGVLEYWMMQHRLQLVILNLLLSLR
jgi:hypothetical protein